MFAQLFVESPRLTELLYTCLCTLPVNQTTAAAAAAAAAAVPAAPSAAASAADKGIWLSSVVQHVGYVSALKYLLVVLQPSRQLGRQALQALAPDVAQMEAAAAPEYLGGVIISTLASKGVSLCP
jgi:hypothetical protein